MEIRDIAAAEKLLYDMDMEESNWRAARLKVGELLAAVRQASKEVNELQTTKDALESGIKNLEQQLAAGHAANKRAHDARLAELAQQEQKVVAELTRADEKAARAVQAMKDAEVAMTDAATRQYEAERRLGEVQTKIQEAEALLAKLTQLR